jgi:hypothetical protein
MPPIAVTLLTHLVGLSLVLVASALLLAEHDHIFARFTASRAATACSGFASPPDELPHCMPADHQLTTVAASLRLPPSSAPIHEAAVELPGFTAPEMSDRLRAPFRTLGGSC